MASVSSSTNSRKTQWVANATALWGAVEHQMVMRNIPQYAGQVRPVFDQVMASMYQRQYDFRSMAEMNDAIIKQMMGLIDRSFPRATASGPATSTPAITTTTKPIVQSAVQTSAPQTQSQIQSQPQPPRLEDAYKNTIEERNYRQTNRMSTMEDEVTRRAEEYKPKSEKPVPELDIPTMTDVADPPEVVERTIEEKIREREMDIARLMPPPPPGTPSASIPPPLATSVNSVNSVVPRQPAKPSSSSFVSTAPPTSLISNIKLSTVSSGSSEPIDFTIPSIRPQPQPQQQSQPQQQTSNVSALKTLFKALSTPAIPTATPPDPPTRPKKVSFVDDNTELAPLHHSSASTPVSSTYTEHFIALTPIADPTGVQQYALKLPHGDGKIQHLQLTSVIRAIVVAGEIPPSVLCVSLGETETGSKRSFYVHARLESSGAERIYVPFNVNQSIDVPVSGDIVIELADMYGGAISMGDDVKIYVICGVN